MGSRGDIDLLGTGEDIGTGDVGLGVTVLAGLGGGDLDDLAGEALEEDNHALLDLTSTDGVRLLGHLAGGLERVNFSHF